ncbi:AAA family ATPase [Vibrio sp. SG41-7]|uniref:AAA family ATPase n=1 Tax=Vibrio sp. SG41-7 TaxID=2760973 RepID=UPI0016034C69|nr:AAA family ATPase [Vibrio sp. SG41-7]MBB1465544.1 AAA family ATPase [Vibrio sp. SG41-7]
MQYNKLTLALGLSCSVALVGCDDDSSSSSSGDGSGSSSSSSTYSVTAIDGYLKGAEVWLDLNSNFVLDEGEPTVTSGDGGVAVLDVAGIDNPESYPVVVRAIANQTVDEEQGLVTTDYVMSAPAGETSVTPLSTLVHVILEQTSADGDTAEQIEEKKQLAIAKVSDQLGIPVDNILGDFIEDGNSDAAYAAENIVASNILPDTPEDLSDVAEEDSESSSFVMTTEVINTQIRDLIDSAEQNGGEADDFAALEDAFDGTEDLTQDTDSDGIPDDLDAFPSNAEEYIDSDGDGTGNNADTNDDSRFVNSEWVEDAFEDSDDLFPTDPDRAGDSDDDGYDSLVDVFPTDGTEWADNDSDDLGDNADLDDDNDGVNDDFDTDPLDESLGNTATALAAQSLYSGSMFYVLDGDYDDGILESENFQISGLGAELTSLTEITQVGEEELDLQEDDDRVLTSAGWVYLDGVYSVDYVDGEFEVYATNYSEVDYTATAVVTDLSGTNIDSYVTSNEIWDGANDLAATFSDGAVSVELVMTPEQDVYYFWDSEPWVFRGDFGVSDGHNASTLEELIVDSSVGESVNTGVLFGTMLTGDENIGGAVELVDGGVANYYTMDWTTSDYDNSATRIATGDWSEVTVNGETMLSFSVPDAVLTEWSGMWNHDSNNFIYVVYDGAVYEGSREIADEPLTDDTTVFINDTAKEDIVAQLSLPIGRCYIGDSDDASSIDEYDQAITDCGGLESAITSEMVVGNTFHRVRGDDSTRDYYFLDSGRVHVAKNGIYSYTEDWSIEGDYLVISDEEGEYTWTWGLIKSDDNEWSVKYYEEDLVEGMNYIWTSTLTETGIPVCVLEEVDYDVNAITRSGFLSDYDDYRQCITDGGGTSIDLSTEEIANTLWLRVRGGLSVRAFEFGAVDTGTWYRNGVQNDNFSYVVEDNVIKVEFEDWYVMMAPMADNGNDNITFAHYSDQYEGSTLYDEIYIDDLTDVTSVTIQECSNGNTEWDDVNDVPLTFGSYDDYVDAVDMCIDNSGIEAEFGDDFFDKAETHGLVFATDDESFTLSANGVGTYADDSDEFPLTWSVSDGMLTMTITAGDITAIDNMVLVDTNGIEMSIKSFSRSNEDGWDGIGDDSDGDIWGDVYTVSYAP